MENSLKKIAEQLDAYDEASLTSLWEKYHNIVKNFEPTKKWEEAALILSLIQAVRWKNQLFNVKWAVQRLPSSRSSQSSLLPSEGSEDSTENKESGEKGKVISFWQKKFDLDD